MGLYEYPLHKTYKVFEIWDAEILVWRNNIHIYVFCASLSWSHNTWSCMCLDYDIDILGSQHYESPAFCWKFFAWLHAVLFSIFSINPKNVFKHLKYGFFLNDEVFACLPTCLTTITGVPHQPLCIWPLYLPRAKVI